MVTVVEDAGSAFAGSAAAPRTRPVLAALLLKTDAGRDGVRNVAVRLPAGKRTSGQWTAFLEVGEEGEEGEGTRALGRAAEYTFLSTNEKE
jgi:hypothetical protein